MVSGAQCRHPTALYCIFSTINTVIGLCLATKSVDLWRNLCASLLYFVVRVRCRRKKFTFAISFADELFVIFIRNNAVIDMH